MFFLKTIQKNKFLNASSWLVAAGIAGGVLGYIFQIVMGRLLEPQEYGLFSAIVATYTILASPLNTLMMIVSRKVAEYSAIRDSKIVAEFYADINGDSIKLSLVLLLLYSLSTSVAMTYLKTNNVIHVLLLGLLMVFTLPFMINLGFIQGLQNFRFLATAQFFQISLKFVFSIALVFIGFGVSGAITGVLLSLIVISYWIHYRLGFSFHLDDIGIKTNTARHITIKHSFPVLVANTAFTGMAYMDIVLVNYYFTPLESGSYAVAAILGKAILYIPASIAQALYPIVSGLHAKQEENTKILIHALLLVLFISTVGATIYYLLSDYIILLLFGDEYVQAAILLKYYGFAMLPLTLILVAEYYLIAKSRVLFAYLFGIGFPAQLAAIHFDHESMMSVIGIMGLTGLLVTFVGFLILWLQHTLGRL